MGHGGLMAGVPLAKTRNEKEAVRDKFKHLVLSRGLRPLDGGGKAFETAAGWPQAQGQSRPALLRVCIQRLLRARHSPRAYFSLQQDPTISHSG